MLLSCLRAALCAALFPVILQAQSIDLSLPVGTPVGAAGVNSSGGSTYTIPITVLSGTNGMQPAINLVYSSQAGEGVAGWGWSLSCLSAVSRTGKSYYYNGVNTPVKYTADDGFMLDGQRMFSTGTNVYGLENEQFSKIEYSGDVFKVTTKDGRVCEYSTRMLTDDGASTMLWLLTKVTDLNGNYQTYQYSVDATNRSYRLTEIQYGGNKVDFTYSSRSDASYNVRYDGGASLRKAFVLSGISISKVNGPVIRSYALNYQQRNNHYLLRTVTEKGYDGVGYNPLVFTYGADTTAANVAVSDVYKGMHTGNVYAGDFDGDGKEDVLQSNYSIDANNVPHYTSYDVLGNFGSYNGLPTAAYFYNYQVPSGIAAEVKGSNDSYYNFLTFDYDGDSKDDVLMVNSLTSGNNRLFNGVRINYSRKFSLFSGPTYDSVSYLSLPHSLLYSQDFKYMYFQGSYFVAGDFDGDGAEDYILVLGMNASNQFKGFFSSPQRGILNQEIYQFGVEGTATDPFYANSIASATQLIPIDFDGDGKKEILVVKDNQSYVLSINPLAPSTGYSYTSQVLYTLPAIKSRLPVFPGDFNGDGKTDLLYRNAATLATGSWFVLMSTGKAYNSIPFPFANRPYLPADKSSSAHHIMVADINGDGKSDVWHSFDVSTTSSRHMVYYSEGLAFTSESYDMPVSVNGSIAANSVIGDFNGDGVPDILSVNDKGEGRFIYPKPFKEDHLLTNVVNGLGAHEGFNYALTTNAAVYNRSPQYEYDTRGFSFVAYNVLNAPMYVVAQSYHSNGGYTSYHYRDMAFQRSRGFIGFKLVSSTDNLTGILTTTENEIEPDLLVPYTKHVYSLLNTDTLSDAKVSSVFLKLAGKRYVYQVTGTLSTNGITGSVAAVNNTYDDYGNITRQVTDVGVEQVTKSSTFGVHGTPFPAFPDAVTVSFVRNGQPAISNTTTYSYNTQGQLLNTVVYAGKPNAITTTYAYDAFGNITQTDLSAAGVSTRTQKFTYDNTGRYLLQTEIPGSISKKTTFAYEPIFGNLQKVVAADGLSTSYTYDRFGRLSVTTLPEGYNITTAYAWDNVYGRYSVNVTRPGGGNDVKTYYDVLGRPVRQEISGFNGGSLVAVKTYNAKGQEESSVAPHYSNETSVTTTNYYDAYGRISQVSNGVATISYAYNKLAGGQYQVNSSNTAGQNSSQLQDAAGRVITAFDAGGSLNYNYDSQGRLISTLLNGVTVNSCTYDDYGNRLSLTDRNAGTYNYQYDAFGHLTAQIFPSGQTTKYTYDSFGRLVTRTAPEGTTSYEYWNEAGTGYCNDNITRITGFSGDVHEYTYDALRRPLTDKITIDGGTYTTQYGYDAYSNVRSVTYPSGVTINRTFDQNSTVTAVKLGDDTTLFTALGMNGLGKYTSYNLGNGKTTTENYDISLGLLTNSATAGVQNMGFSFDPSTGNLLSRKDGLHGLEETFTYDNMNRLLTTGINGLQQQAITYDNNTGNISSKTDAGNYIYNSQRTNALAIITNPLGDQLPPAIISQDRQDVTYTPFQKVSTISESGHQLVYTYGFDYQRIKSVSNSSEIRYYLGAYEKQLQSTATRDLHYIMAGNGLCAIIVRENGVNNIFYTYTDHLGSIINVTDAHGALIASQNFDAWGRHRNPLTWDYNNIPSPPDWLYRGFTGHEHLTDFSLINMNGRVYDPITGRMLSADNYVQSPFNTQSYNRYSYCINNPLRYTDPNGNYFGADDAVAAILGGVVNLGINLFEGHVHSVWQGLGYFAVGAVSGELSLYGPAGWMAAGAVTGALNAKLQGADPATVSQSASTGAIAGLISGGVSQGASSALGDGIASALGVSANSVLARGATGSISGAISGFAGGFATSYLSDGDVAAASKAGLSGLALGGSIGLTVGGVSAYAELNGTGVNPMTGQAYPTGNIQLGVMTMQMPDYVAEDGNIVSGNIYEADLSNGGRTTIEFPGGLNVNRIYSARALYRMSDGSTYHNFPESFNQTIFDQGTRTPNPNYFNQAKPNLSLDGATYTLPGSINGKSGTYEIGVRLSLSGRTEVIIHRFFNPNY
jgi:RHS repeat-associated protein